MRLHILSDLHLEFGAFEVPDTGADVVVLAGDTCTGKRGIRWALEYLPDMLVVYLLGNHEYYGKTWLKLIDDLKDDARGTNVCVLENDVLKLGSLVFLGCTLWADFRLHGDPRMAGHVAGQGMTDYKRIRVSPEFRRLQPGDSAGMHRASLSWLREQLAVYRDEQVVVVTHHAPSRRSLANRGSKDPLDPAYASDLEELVKESKARLWIHGHIHTASDYRLGSTRVICNPRGYPGEEGNGFRGDLVVDI